MYKKSSSDTGGGRKNFSSSRKEDGRGGNSGKKPFNRPSRDNNEGREDSRSRKPFRAADNDGEKRPRRDEGRNAGFEKRPYNKDSRDSRPGARDGNDRPRKPFGERKEGEGSARPYQKRDGQDQRAGGFRDNNDRPRRQFGEDRGEERKPRPYPKRDDQNGGDRPAGRAPFKRRDEGAEGRPERSSRGFQSGDKPAFRKRTNDNREDSPRREYKKNFRSDDRGEGGGDRKPSGRGEKKAFPGMPERRKTRESFKRDTYADEPRKEFVKRERSPELDAEYYGDDAEWELTKDKRPKRQAAASYPMPLNKFIAHSGECSRRDAAELVKQGKAKVNGELITDPGHKINEGDKITLSGKKLTPQKGLVYILLNKPKGFITTNEDDRGRKTVMDLVGNSADVGRVFPVGRLDRATTGLLLLTNDGAITQKLAHPSFNVKKVYHVTLDKNLTQGDFDKIMEGLELEDGKAVVDEMAYLEKKNELGVEIHSGKNRIVRRIFESLGYVVDKLDRMMYAGLTKKNLPRGKWRFLDEREIVLLKHFKS
jgi:23S rRNA pseudouridine2605 synthase